MRQVRWIGGVVLVGVLARGAALLRAAVPEKERDAGGADCVASPAAAVRAAHANAGARANGQASGYRVEAVRWDPILRQSWAVIRSCEHRDRSPLLVATDLPAFPATMSGTDSSGAALTASQGPMAQAVVRSGDRVRLWKSDRYAHIEMTGTSEENGAIGARVRIRLATARDGDGQLSALQYLAGVVRGPADVEMER